jgi:hypothetical protein
VDHRALAGGEESVPGGVAAAVLERALLLHVHERLHVLDVQRAVDLELGVESRHPLALVASGTSWMALNCSNCAHVGHAVVNAHGAALAALIFRAAAMRSGHVCGGLAGSRPAFLKASLL